MSTGAIHIIKELLDRMGFLGAKIDERDIGGRLKIEIKLSDARELIGERGATLTFFEHVARRILSRRISPPPLVDIDINGYKMLREDVLRDFARDIGSRVRLSKKPVELDPMPSFDRRIIHLTLANFSDLTTESMGEGERRYIVVRPYPQENAAISFV